LVARAERVEAAAVAAAVAALPAVTKVDRISGVDLMSGVGRHAGAPLGAASAAVQVHPRPERAAHTRGKVHTCAHGVLPVG